VADEIAHWINPDVTTPATTLTDYAAHRMMDDTDADRRTAWATVLRITLGNW
jgi:hypothetical protein